MLLRRRMTALLTGLFLMVGVATAAENPYTATMRSLMTQLDTVESMSGNLKLAHAFVRIAETEKTQWLPYYYAAYAYVQAAFAEQNPGKIDPLCDQAETLLEKVDALSPRNSEASCIRSMVALARISVNYMQRGMANLVLSQDHLKKAIELDPNNPRPYLMLGQQAYRTPEAFGGSKKEALKYYEKALALYEAAPTGTDELRVDWGKSTARRMADLCRQQLAAK